MNEKLVFTDSVIFKYTFLLFLLIVQDNVSFLVYVNGLCEDIIGKLSVKFKVIEFKLIQFIITIQVPVVYFIRSKPLLKYQCLF